jgi:hypothetical protein
MNEKKNGTLHGNFFERITKFISKFFKIPQTKTNKRLRLTIKFKANVETVPRQPFDTYGHECKHFDVHCAQ